MATVLSQIEKRLRDKHVNILGSDIRRIIKLIFSEIFEALYRDLPVEIRRYGRFSTKIRKPRTSRNPRTGVKLLVPSKLLVASCNLKSVQTIFQTVVIIKISLLNGLMLIKFASVCCKV